jgi:hydroxymethylglutaryl-CoA lyase
VRVKYGEGFTGSIATEDLVSLFESLGIRTGIDLDKPVDTARLCERSLGRDLYGRVTRSGVNPLIATGRA